MKTLSYKVQNQPRLGGRMDKSSSGSVSLSTASSSSLRVRFIVRRSSASENGGHI